MKDNPLLDIARANFPFVERLYEQYRKDPKSVSQEWIEVFKELELLPATPTIQPQAKYTEAATDEGCRIQHLIQAYRTWGYLAVPVNPIALTAPQEPRQLALENLGFHSQDLSKEFPTEGLLNNNRAPLLEILQALKRIYCERIGYEYIDHQTPEFEKWLQSQIETKAPLKLTTEQKQSILEQLNKAELFETFIHTKFPGQKRFSIEGGETFIPILAAVIERGADLGSNEYILGMSHRGRLNVLANILDKPYAEIFYEFDEGYFPDSFEGSGDVKYHKGFLSESVKIHGHSVKITLTPNPSHLESVDAVVEGQVKATQIKKGDFDQNKIIPILVHGDAAVSGQGVLYETLQLSQLNGYSTGGTVHIVINNQIGFTTLPKDARSTPFCTDISKAFGCPVFHVNAEDPEACVFAAYLAAEIRQKFHIDVFIDLNCYRKWGHNESDEPAFTQPIEYGLIRKKKTIREIYQDQLINEGVIEKFLAEGLEVEFKKALQDALRDVGLPKKPEKREIIETQKTSLFKTFDSGVSKSTLQEAAARYSVIPQDFKIHPKLEQLLKDRMDMVIKENAPIDWGMAETLAFATLLFESIHIRLSGQDSGRGTFSHRHALWMDQNVEDAYFPLSHLGDGQGRSDIINSPLSEFAVLGFEYGYSIGYPEALVLWEAQFGDFSNGAQVVIDQYISSAEAKWGQKSTLTLLLPHGYEGQGPEHSSSRLERYLSLAGNDNMIIAQPSTPAQYFHLLRRQALAGLNKPLICLTPKQLLRHTECISTIKDFEKGGFEGILDDPKHNTSASRLVFCTGRIYYELTQFRAKEKIDDLALIRIEQLYPLDEVKLASLIKSYPRAQRFFWVQDEPKNMGAFSYIHPLLENLLPKKNQLEYVGRDQSASPATGSYHIHKKELAAILQTLLIEKKALKVEVSPFHRA